jgi:hypothetical protein
MHCSVIVRESETTQQGGWGGGGTHLQSREEFQLAKNYLSFSDATTCLLLQLMGRIKGS